MKSKIALFWVLAVFMVATTVFVYFFLGETSKTLPKIKLSYFSDEKEVAQSVVKRLSQELAQNNFIWLGVEPEKNEQLEIVESLKNELEKNSPFAHVIVDEELKLSSDFVKKIKANQVVILKENLSVIGEKLKDLEKENQRYLIITAAIYSNSVLKQNPINILKEKFLIRPMTFSMAYFPASTDEERNMIFPCRTDDKSGTADWGCLIVNKARFSRRKFEFQNKKPWSGLMDLSGENDYILMLRKNEFGK